jgi:hypothetical protein
MTEEDISKIVHEKFDNRVGFDPFTILTIISICLTVYRIIQNCRASKAVIKASAKRKGLAYKVFVDKNLRKQLLLAGVNEETAEEIIEDLRQKFISDE